VTYDFNSFSIYCLSCILKMAVFSVVVSCSLVEVSELIALMMEAASTSVTSVNLYQTTQRNNPEDSHLHICCWKNLKSHEVVYFSEFTFLFSSIYLSSYKGLTSCTHCVKDTVSDIILRLEVQNTETTCFSTSLYFSTLLQINPNLIFCWISSTFLNGLLTVSHSKH
jgi:hypothetical protein